MPRARSFPLPITRSRCLQPPAPRVSLAAGRGPGLGLHRPARGWEWGRTGTRTALPRRLGTE